MLELITFRRQLFTFTGAPLTTCDGDASAAILLHAAARSMRAARWQTSRPKTLTPAPAQSGPSFPFRAC